MDKDTSIYGSSDEAVEAGAIKGKNFIDLTTVKDRANGYERIVGDSYGSEVVLVPLGADDG